MAPRRLSFVAVAAVLGAVVALWLSAGTLTVANGDPGAARIALLATPRWLVLLTIAGLVLVLVIRPAATRAAVLALSFFILLPWIPRPLPYAAFVWTGPLRLWLWLAIAAALIVPFARRAAPSMLRHIATDPRRAPWLAAAVAACAYVLGAWQVFPRLPAGDEPHYLVITQSLLNDHDLKIENNHRQGDYHAYYGGELKPDYLRRGRDGEIYSIHAPGLPGIVAPVFALFGYPGVVVLLALASGCATALTWSAVWRTTSDAAASWFGWAAVALSVPFLFQSFVAFPDGPGAILVMIGVVAMLAGRDASERFLLAAAVALAILPWLHTRFAVLAVVLGALIAARNLGSPAIVRRAAALFLIPALSAAAWFWFFYAIYGTPNPAAPYGHYTQSSLGNLARGVPGLLFDQQFGLIPNAPVYICAGLGFTVMSRRLPRLTIELLLVAVPYGLAVAAYQMWWGGLSSPARFLVPVMLPLAIPAGVWFASAGRGSRIAGLGALLLSLCITGALAMVRHGALLYNVRDGAARWLLWISPLVNLTTGLPSLFQNAPPIVLGQSLIWAFVIAATWWMSVFAARRGLTSEIVALVAGSTAATGGMIALTIVWRTNHAPPLTPTAGNVALLRHYDPARRQIALRFPPLTRVPQADVPPSLTVATDGLDRDHVKRYSRAQIFLVDGAAYMEPSGAWVPGRDDAMFVLEPDPGTPLRLFVRNTPVENHVTFVSGAWRQEMTLAPREERLIDVPVDAGRMRAVLHVTSAAGARPVDMEPRSTDRRLLGCWIEIR
jgi:hypothetical protein